MTAVKWLVLLGALLVLSIALLAGGERGPLVAAILGALGGAFLAVLWGEVARRRSRSSTDSPRFVHPAQGETLAYEGEWGFEVHDYPGAEGYLWNVTAEPGNRSVRFEQWGDAGRDFTVPAEIRARAEPNSNVLVAVQAILAHDGGGITKLSDVADVAVIVEPSDRTV